MISRKKMAAPFNSVKCRCRVLTRCRDFLESLVAAVSGDIDMKEKNLDIGQMDRFFRWSFE